MLVSYSQVQNIHVLSLYNTNVINPAYAGNNGSLNISAVYGTQWIGVIGAPKNFLFNVHAPIFDGFGAGISYERGTIGPLTENGINIDFSYKYDLTEKNHLAVGVKYLHKQVRGFRIW